MTSPTTTDRTDTRQHILALAWPIILSNITVPLLGLAFLAFAVVRTAVLMAYYRHHRRSRWHHPTSAEGVDEVSRPG